MDLKRDPRPQPRFLAIDSRQALGFGASFRRSLRGGFMVAVAKVRHQSGYGISLKRGRVGHTGPQFNPRKKNSKVAIQSARLLSHYGLSSR